MSGMYKCTLHSTPASLFFFFVFFFRDFSLVGWLSLTLVLYVLLTITHITHSLTHITRSHHAHHITHITQLTLKTHTHNFAKARGAKIPMLRVMMTRWWRWRWRWTDMKKKRKREKRKRKGKKFTIQFDTIRCGSIRYDTLCIWYDAIRCDTIRYLRYLRLQNNFTAGKKLGKVGT